MQLSNALIIDMSKAHVLDKNLEIGCGPFPTCSPMWQSNYLQGWAEGSSAREIAGYPNSTPREGVEASEEEATGKDVAATAVTTMDLTGTFQEIAGFMKWTDPNSGGVFPAKSLTRMGVMGAYMYSTSAIVTRTPATSRRFSNAVQMMVALLNLLDVA